MELRFTPHHEKDYSFQLKCKVKSKATPLLLKVTAEGYSINFNLIYTSPDGSELQLPIKPSDERKIDFGKVEVNDNALGQISVSNKSQYNFEYRWVLSHMHKSHHIGVVSVEPEAGEVAAGTRAASQLTFSPNKKMTLKNCLLTLEVRVISTWETLLASN